MKKIKAFLMLGILAVSGMMLFVACDDKPKTPTVKPVVDANVYFLNSMTLNDVDINVNDESTEGEINWVNATAPIEMGVNYYEWEFVPEDDDYKKIKGTAKITGYQLVDLSEIDLRESVPYSEELEFNALSGLVFDQIDSTKFTTQILSTGEYNQVGEYTDLSVKIVPKGFYKILGENNTILSELTKTFSLEITKTQAEVASAEELVDIVNNKTETVNKVILTQDISNVENNELLLTAYNKDIDLTIDLNGHNIFAGIKIGNHNVVNHTVYNNICKVTIINSAETGSTIGGNNISTGIKVFGDIKTEVNISNVTVYGNVFGLSTNGFCSGAKINADHSCFISLIDADSTGLVDGVGAFLPAYYNCTFTHCCFQGGNGLYIKSGENVFNGCSIVGTSKQADITYSGNGCNITGDAVVLDATYGYHKPLNVTLNECLLFSNNAYLVQEAVSDKSATELATYNANVTITNCMKDADPDVVLTADDIKFETNEAITLNGNKLSNAQ